MATARSARRNWPRTTTSPDAVAKLFDELDGDGSGEIGVEEFFSALAETFAPEKLNLLKDIDLNGDGVISKDELAAHYGLPVEAGETLCRAGH